MHLSTKSPVAAWQAGEIQGTLARRLFSIPFVYGLLLPIALLDAAVSFYQAVTFRLWRIPRARRSSHLILDRHKITYLNRSQKLNCLCFGYSTLVLSYSREISARTKQYWRPIKHAVEPSAPHARYANFIDYADAQGFPRRTPQLRAAVQSPPPARPLIDNADAPASGVTKIPKSK